MPLVTVDVSSGLGSNRLRAIGEAIHDALVQALSIPDDDDFIAIHEHTAETLRIHPSFFDIERSAEAMLIQITLRERPVETRRALFRALADRLHEDAGVRQEDVFVSLVHVPNENWSFGLGEAQLAEREPPW
jgi:phenylpyruvate tautomerase PptA (4-oxalocrotonate tautomerase family)